MGDTSEQGERPASESTAARQRRSRPSLYLILVRVVLINVTGEYAMFLMISLPFSAACLEC